MTQLFRKGVGGKMHVTVHNYHVQVYPFPTAPIQFGLS